MSDKIKRIRCGTKKCTGFVDTQVSTEIMKDGNWQFHCSVCKFWSLVSLEGNVKATSREQFDLDRLPSNVRFAFSSLRREPPGGV